MQRVSQAISPDLLGAIGIGKRSYLIKELEPTADRINLPALNGDKRALGEVMHSMAQGIAWAHLRGSARFGSDSVEKLAEYAAQQVWKERIKHVALESASRVVEQWQAYKTDYDASGDAFADLM